MNKIKISVIIPSYNTPKNYLLNLYNSLLNQSIQNFEVIIVDDCSKFDFYYLIKDPRFKIIRKEKNTGPADSRNIGAKNSSSNFLFFTDSDCKLHKNTLKIVIESLEKENIVMGNTITKVKTRKGKVIAYLGFPGGGILGFDKVWKVDKENYTYSISSCNLAIRKDVFFKLGGFDTTFPVPGGEDTVFGQIALKKGYKIKYSPLQIVYHVEKNSILSFIRWQITRGRGNYYIKKRLKSVNKFLKLRLWSFKNSLLESGPGLMVFVFILILLSVIFQTIGYYKEKIENKFQ